MSKPDYHNIALKIGKMGLFADIHQLGAPSDGHPVDIYCETLDGIRFYVSYSKYDRCGWSVEHAQDPSVKMRKDFHKRWGLKNQTEALKYVKETIVSKSKYARK